MNELPPPVPPIYNEQSYHTPENAEYKVLSPKKLTQLKAQGFPQGLYQTLYQSVNEFPLRIWVVDNSGSMTIPDGHRFVETSDKSKVKVVQCTRWAELQEAVVYHAEISALLSAPTIFRFLNPSAGLIELSIADKGANMIESELRIIKETMRRATPMGITPLSRHIRDIKSNVEIMHPSLRSEGKRVAVILATDGLPSNDQGQSGAAERREFVEAMKSLEGLPIWIVVRLCTDDEEICQFYNSLDAQLVLIQELSIEVLDDFEAEAEEVSRENSWLNYCLPLHRCRELGYHNRLFDMLDERQLTLGEIRQFCNILFGDVIYDEVPDPEADFGEFLHKIKPILEKEGKQWNPVKKKAEYMIDLYTLNSIFGDRSYCSVM